MQKLSAEEVSTALEALPGWEGGPERIERTVPVPPQDQEQFTKAVRAVADEVNHHPDLETGQDGVQVVLTTHEAGGVTDRDIELASHLDRLFSGGVAWDKY